MVDSALENFGHWWNAAGQIAVVHQGAVMSPDAVGPRAFAALSVSRNWYPGIGHCQPAQRILPQQRFFWLKTAVLLFMTVLGALLSLQVAAAQDAVPDSSPLSVTTQFSSGLSGDCKTGEGLVVQLHYTGTQPLRGYLVRVELTNSTTGKVFQKQVLQEIRGSREPMIPSGAEWTRTVCSVPKKVLSDAMAVSTKVDVLKFADGSIWGPLELRESHQLVGSLDGMDFIGKTTELERFVSPIPPDRGPAPVEDVQTQTIGPLRIESGVWQDEDGQDMMAVEITNESDTPIRGYLFNTSFFDPATGTHIRRFSTKELETHGNQSDYLAPGSTWLADPRKFSHLADGSLASYTIKLDLVVFADGSIFGPKKSQESDEVLGMLQGIDAANRASRETSVNKE